MHFLEQKSIGSEEIIFFNRKSFTDRNNSSDRKVISFDKKQIILTATHSLGHETIHLKGNNFFSQGNFPFDRTSFYFISSQVFRLKSTDFVGISRLGGEEGYLVIQTFYWEGLRG